MKHQMSQQVNSRINLATLVTVVIFMISSIWSTAIWKTEFEITIERNEERGKKNTIMIDEHHESLNSQEVILREIQTDISWIRLQMQEDKDK